MYLELIRHCYEAYTLYLFFMLLVNYLEGEENIIAIFGMLTMLLLFFFAFFFAFFFGYWSHTHTHTHNAYTHTHTHLHTHI